MYDCRTSASFLEIASEPPGYKHTPWSARGQETLAQDAMSDEFRPSSTREWNDEPKVVAPTVYPSSKVGTARAAQEKSEATSNSSGTSNSESA